MVLALSIIFPDIRIEFWYADEDAGSNTGYGVAEGGEFQEWNHPDDGSDEAMGVYFETHPGEKDRFEKMNGEWRYKEE